MATVSSLLSLTKCYNINYLNSFFNGHDCFLYSYGDGFSAMSYEEQRYVVNWIKNVVSVIGGEASSLVESLLKTRIHGSLTSEESDWALKCAASLLSECSGQMSKDQRKNLIGAFLRCSMLMTPTKTYYVQFLLKKCSADLSEDQRLFFLRVYLGHVLIRKDSLSLPAARVLMKKCCSAYLSEDQRKEIIEVSFDLMLKGDRDHVIYAKFLVTRCFADLTKDQRKKVIEMFVDWVVKSPLARKIGDQLGDQFINKVIIRPLVNCVLKEDDTYCAKLLLEKCSANLSRDQHQRIKMITLIIERRGSRY
jgi:hypothetical protein